MKQQSEIRGQVVGKGAPVFIIAEAGSNHLGSIETALGLDVAAAAKADAVKFQTFKAERLYADGAGSSDYLGDTRSINDIIKSMEMPESWLPTLRDAAHAKGMAFLSTPFHLEAVGVLEPLVDAFKIASYEMSHHPLFTPGSAVWEARHHVDWRPYRGGSSSGCRSLARRGLSGPCPSSVYSSLSSPPRGHEPAGIAHSERAIRCPIWAFGSFAGSRCSPYGGNSIGSIHYREAFHALKPFARSGPRLCR